MTIKKILVTILASIVLVFDITLVPIYYQLKTWYLVIKNWNTKYKFYHSHGGFIITRDFDKEIIDKCFMLYVVPDKNIWTMWYRKLTFKGKFVVTFSFDEYTKCDKIKLVSTYATIQDYRARKLSKLTGLNVDLL